MLNIDKITIINSFIQVVKLIKGVRNELSTDIDNLKQATKESSEIDDTNVDSLTTTFSAKKIKEFINDKINEFLQEDEERDAAIEGLLKQMTTKVATTEGLLSIDSQQTLTDEQKAQVLANLGINKSTLIKMLVDDESVIDSNNLLSAKKVSDMISDYVTKLDSDEVFTDAEFEEYLQANAFVPKPNKPGQVLRARLVDGKLSIVWEDEVATPPATPTTGNTDTVSTPAPEDTVSGEDTVFGDETAETTGDTNIDKGEDVQPSVATEEQESPAQPSAEDTTEAGTVPPAEEPPPPVYNIYPRSGTSVRWDINKVNYRSNDTKWLNENANTRSAMFDAESNTHYIDIDVTPIVDTTKPVRVASIASGGMVSELSRVEVGTGEFYKLVDDKYIYAKGLTVGQRVQARLVLKYSDSVGEPTVPTKFETIERVEEEEEVPSADIAEDTESETTVGGAPDGATAGPGTEPLPELTPGSGEGSGSYGD